MIRIRRTILEIGIVMLRLYLPPEVEIDSSEPCRNISRHLHGERTTGGTFRGEHVKLDRGMKSEFPAEAPEAVLWPSGSTGLSRLLKFFGAKKSKGNVLIPMSGFNQS